MVGTDTRQREIAALRADARRTKSSKFGVVAGGFGVKVGPVCPISQNKFLRWNLMSERVLLGVQQGEVLHEH